MHTLFNFLPTTEAQMQTTIRIRREDGRKRETHTTPKKEIQMCAHMHMEGQIASGVFFTVYNVHVAHLPLGPSQKHK